MSRAKQDFGRIRHDLSSENQEVRGLAMQDLAMWAARDPAIHERALPLFREAIATAPDAWTAGSAARGIESVEGVEAGQQALRALLHRSDAGVRAHAALAMTSSAFFDDLMAVLADTDEPRVVCAALRKLGRMGDPRAFDAIAHLHGQRETRPDAIQALGELLDTRGIRALEACLDDTTELWREDNHGPMLRVCDLALDTIGLLRAKGRESGRS